MSWLYILAYALGMMRAFIQAREAHEADVRKQGAAMLAEQLAEHELQKMLEEERLEAVSAACALMLSGRWTLKTRITTLRHSKSMSSLSPFREGQYQWLRRGRK